MFLTPPQGIILHYLVSHTPAPLETNLCSDNYEKLEPSALHGGRISGNLSFINWNAHDELGINRLSREMHRHRLRLCHQEGVGGLVCPRGATISSPGPRAQPQQCLGTSLLSLFQPKGPDWKSHPVGSQSLPTGPLVCAYFSPTLRSGCISLINAFHQMGPIPSFHFHTLVSVM